MTAEAPARCPYSRSLSYVTMEYSLTISHGHLTKILDMIDHLWQRVEDEWKPPSESIGDEFGELMAHIDSLRQWTGWGGVSHEYLAPVPAELLDPEVKS